MLHTKQETKSSKFAPKVDEGFLLGYGTNEHAYRVFNKTTGVVETTVDVKFDESNGSQVGQVDMNLVDDKESPNLAIMRMGFGEVMPREKENNATIEVRNDDPSSSTRVEPSSSQVPQDQSHDHGDDHNYGMDQGGAQGEETQGEAPQVERDDDGEPIQPQCQVSHPRVNQSV